MGSTPDRPLPSGALDGKRRSLVSTKTDGPDSVGSLYLYKPSVGSICPGNRRGKVL